MLASRHLSHVSRRSVPRPLEPRILWFVILMLAVIRERSPRLSTTVVIGLHCKSPLRRLAAPRTRGATPRTPDPRIPRVETHPQIQFGPEKPPRRRRPSRIFGARGILMVRVRARRTTKNKMPKPAAKKAAKKPAAKKKPARQGEPSHPIHARANRFRDPTFKSRARRARARRHQTAWERPPTPPSARRARNARARGPLSPSLARFPPSPEVTAFCPFACHAISRDSHAARPPPPAAAEEDGRQEARRQEEVDCASLATASLGSQLPLLPRAARPPAVMCQS